MKLLYLTIIVIVFLVFSGINFVFVQTTAAVALVFLRPDKEIYFPGDSVFIHGQDDMNVTSITIGLEKDHNVMVSSEDSQVLKNGTFYANFTLPRDSDAKYWSLISGSLHQDLYFKPVYLSPLEQFREGIEPSKTRCESSLDLVISHDNLPACVKPDTAQKLVERGWAKEIVSSMSIKVSQIKNQVISIGNDTYDTIEFQTMTGNTVSLDNVKFTYHGASPLNNNCYPDLTNQTEARDFEMIPGNISDMNTHQCWPPSNYPLKITNENTMPTDLFSKYLINFFDYNQTIGVGWCHSDSCYLGQTLYLVKRSWDAPVTYDDPVSLLEFHLGTNASVISSGQAISIDMSTSNKLPKTILVPSEYNYSFKGTGLGPCTYGPFDLAVLEGFYGENNFTQGNKLSLYQPGIYSCPASIAPQGYKFEPMSNNVVDRCEPFDGCSNTGQIQFRTSFSGSWNNTSFHKFESEVYTIIAGDEWGNHSIKYFTVTR